MGDQDIETWIYQYAPDIVVAGHIHQSPFVKNGSWADRIGATWIFNAGHQFGAPPAHIALDTDLSEAVWISAMDVQSIKLDSSLQRPIPSAAAMPEWFGKEGLKQAARLPSNRSRVLFNPDQPLPGSRSEPG